MNIISVRGEGRNAIFSKNIAYINFFVEIMQSICYNLTMMKIIPKQMKKRELIPNDYFRAEYRERNSPFSLHGHDFYEVEYVVEGRYKNVINGRETVMEQGDFCFLRPGDLHELKWCEVVKMYNLSFMAGALNDALFAKLLSRESGVGKIPAAERVLFEQVFAALCGEDADREYQNGLLSVLLSVVLRVQSQGGGQVDEPMLRAVRFINERALESPSLGEVAAQAGLQVNYFCKAFKRATGKTYIDYLNGIKIDYALRLLRAKDMPVGELCFACGFSSFAQFSREFRKRTGCSPSQLKRNK